MTNNKKNKQNGPRSKSVLAPASRSIAAPASSGALLTPSKFTMQTIADGVVRFRGHELLGQAVTDSNTPIAAVFDLNPACWVNSRLARIAATYEKYRYDSFTIRYHPTVPTTAPNGLATYVELEIDEAVATSVVTALNHQYATMGPAWAPHQVHYRRPPQDPKAYLLTDTAVGNRNDMSQGKIICVSTTDGPQVFGFLSIEYDVVFMYPELETGWPGEQYQLSSASVPIIAANANIVAPPNWTSAGTKVAEIVLNEPLNNTVNAAGSIFSFPIGSVLYTAWDGANWLLYQNIEQALSTVNPLRSAPGLAAFTLNYFVRKLTKEV